MPFMALQQAASGRRNLALLRRIGIWTLPPNCAISVFK